MSAGVGVISQPAASLLKSHPCVPLVAAWKLVFPKMSLQIQLAKTNRHSPPGNSHPPTSESLFGPPVGSLRERRVWVKQAKAKKETGILRMNLSCFSVESKKGCVLSQ